MLFDLRSRGRRTTVRIVYVGLAALIGVGLVGFGIGGGFGSGGIFSAASENGGGGGSSSFASQVAKYRKLTAKQPNDVAAWEGLTKALLHEAAPATENGLSSRGRELLREASDAWERYAALEPRTSNAELALLMVRVYGEEGLNEPAKAVQVLQIAVAARPNSASLYSYLALYAYKSHNTRIGDLAATRAVSLAPAAQRQRLQTELAEVRANPSGEKTFTTTTKGKTFVGKPGPNGTFTGTVVTGSSPPPASSTTTTKK